MSQVFYWPIIYITQPNSSFLRDETLQLNSLKNVLPPNTELYFQDQFHKDAKRDSLYQEEVEVTIPLCGAQLDKCTADCESVLKSILDFVCEKLRAKYNGITLVKYLALYEDYMSPFCQKSINQFDIYVTLYTKVVKTNNECYVRYKSWRLSDNLDDLKDFDDKLDQLKIDWDRTDRMDRKVQSGHEQNTNISRLKKKRTQPIPVPRGYDSSDSDTKELLPPELNDLHNQHQPNYKDFDIYGNLYVGSPVTKNYTSIEDYF